MARNDSQSVFGRFFTSIAERREQRKEENFLNSLPKPYAAFMERYIPDNAENEEVFNKIKKLLEGNPNTLSVCIEEFAQIGDSYLLQHIWKETSINEPDIRKAVIENPECPKDSILEAISDPFSEVAVAAVLNPLVTEEECLQAVNRINRVGSAVQEALEKRLEEFGYEVDWGSTNPEHNNDLVISKKQNRVNSVLEENKNSLKNNSHSISRTTGIDSMIANAHSRSMINKSVEYKEKDREVNYSGR